MDRIAIEDKIKEMLAHADYPVKAKEIAAMLDISEREVRRLVRELIGRGVMIASTMERPYGYFLPRTTKEIERYARQLKSRIAKIAERLHDFDRATATKIQGILFPDRVA
jgi:predicted DNA-binding transcriptional regulator